MVGRVDELFLLRISNLALVVADLVRAGRNEIAEADTGGSLEVVAEVVVAAKAVAARMTAGLCA